MTAVAVVTGATGAIGRAIAREIAARGDHEVLLLCRNRDRAARTVAEIRMETGNPAVSFAVVDLARRTAIEAWAADWNRPVQILVNNAAIAPLVREETPEGIEMQFATNVLAYDRLTRALEPWLIRAAPARVVNVASYWAGDLDLHDPEFKRRPYDQHQAYRQSKQADRMLTVAFADRLRPHGVRVNACHSGDVPSALSHALGFGGHETPQQGALTPVWLATDPAVGEVTGQYFEQCRAVHCPYGNDRRQVAALVEVCRRYVR